jgi:hypothetical protein
MNDAASGTQGVRNLLVVDPTILSVFKASYCSPGSEGMETVDARPLEAMLGLRAHLTSDIQARRILGVFKG